MHHHDTLNFDSLKDLDPAATARMRVAVVASRFNGHIVDRLIEGVVDALMKKGVQRERIVLRRVPGAYEIPLACQDACREKPDAVIALGAVIRGDTSHYDVIVSEVASGVMNVMLNHQTPIILGVLTVESEQQALDRIDRASDFALSAIETALGRKRSEIL